MLHVDEFGSGPTDVVLLHGAPQHPINLQPLARRLAERHRVLVVHNPGYGESRHVPRIGDMGAVQEAIVEALLHHDATRPTIAGISGGAYRALLLAASGAVGLRSLVLLGGFASLPDDVRAGFRDFARAIRAGTVDLTASYKDVCFGAAYRSTNEDAVEHATRAALLVGSDFIAEERDSFADCPDLRSALPLLSIPIVACVGEKDIAVPIARSEEIAALARRCELRVFRGCGHAIHEEAFEDVVAAIDWSAATNS